MYLILLIGAERFKELRQSVVGTGFDGLPDHYLYLSSWRLGMKRPSYLVRKGLFPSISDLLQYLSDGAAIHLTRNAIGIDLVLPLFDPTAIVDCGGQRE